MNGYMFIKEPSSIRMSLKEACKEFAIRQHALGFVDALVADEQLLSLHAAACARLRFRIGVAINSFRIADWYDSLGREGMHVAFVEFSGHLFPPHEMSKSEQAEFAKRGGRNRRSAREMTAKYIDPGAINLLEKSSTARTKDSFMLASELMISSEPVFRRAYWTLVSSVSGGAERNPGCSQHPAPEFASIMSRMGGSFRRWCPQTPDCERVQ